MLRDMSWVFQKSIEELYPPFCQRNTLVRLPLKDVANKSMSCMQIQSRRKLFMKYKKEMRLLIIGAGGLATEIYDWYLSDELKFSKPVRMLTAKSIEKNTSLVYTIWLSGNIAINMMILCQRPLSHSPSKMPTGS